MTQMPRTSATSEESDLPKRLDFSDRLPSPLSDAEIAQRERDQLERERRHELKERENRWRSLIAKRGTLYETCRLNNFCADADAQREVLTDVTRYARSISNHIRAGEGMFLYGPKGTGKDHLLVALSFQAIGHGHRVTWQNGMDLFGDIRDRMDTHESERELVGRLVAAEVLYLSDPLPVEGSLSEFQKSMLFRIIDGRYSHKKPTWITVNVANRKELESRMGAPTVDRIIDRALACYCGWPSHRQKLAAGYPKIAREAT
jgi:DNA replication protein DnaC